MYVQWLLYLQGGDFGNGLVVMLGQLGLLVVYGGFIVLCMQCEQQYDVCLYWFVVIEYWFDQGVGCFGLLFLQFIYGVDDVQLVVCDWIVQVVQQGLLFVQLMFGQFELVLLLCQVDQCQLLQVMGMQYGIIMFLQYWLQQCCNGLQFGMVSVWVQCCYVGVLQVLLYLQVDQCWCCCIFVYCLLYGCVIVLCSSQ